MDAEHNCQFKPPMHGDAGFAFDDNGQRVPTVEPEVSDNDRAEFDSFVAEIRRDTIDRFLNLLLDGGALVNETGLRVHLLAFGRRTHPAQSQLELAAYLEISQSSISKGITKNCEKSSVFKQFWQSLARNRNNLAH